MVGQAHPAIASRLGAVGVDTPAVERQARIGDAWRRRCHALTLHDQAQVATLLHLPLPDSCPTCIAGNKLVGWREHHAEPMERNVWTGMRTLGAERAPSGACRGRLHSPDGAERARPPPRPVILAIGAGGISNRSAIPGCEAFADLVLHAGDDRAGEDFAAPRAPA